MIKKYDQVLYLKEEMSRTHLQNAIFDKLITKSAFIEAFATKCKLKLTNHFERLIEDQNKNFKTWLERIDDYVQGEKQLMDSKANQRLEQVVEELSKETKLEEEEVCGNFARPISWKNSPLAAILIFITRGLDLETDEDLPLVLRQVQNLRSLLFFFSTKLSK